MPRYIQKELVISVIYGDAGADTTGKFPSYEYYP